MDLYVIYSTTETQGSSAGPMLYQVDYLFGPEGILPLANYKEILNNLSVRLSPRGNPLFDTLDDLNRFSFAITEHLELPSIRLYSSYDMNRLLEEATTPDALCALFKERGNIIENIDQKGNKGFFSKLFR